jgi:ABC-type multidrug transport system fused ATPase/permease subunit
MKDLPVPDPGQPDHRSATRYLIWLGRTQASTMLAGMLLGIVWMVAPAFLPAVIGRAIDAVSARDRAGLANATAIVFALAMVQAAAGILRHRMAVTNWLAAAYRTVQVTVAHAARLGATLPKRVAAGEVVSIGTSDIAHIGNALDITARTGRDRRGVCGAVALLARRVGTGAGLAASGAGSSASAARGLARRRRGV